MKKALLTITVVLAFVGSCVAQDPGRPRQKTSPAGKLIYYPPQVDKWDNYKTLDFRMAFSLTPAGGKQTIGVVDIQAQTDVSVDDRTVLLRDPVITHFSSLDSATFAPLDQLVRTFLPASASVLISLDLLIAATSKTEAPRRARTFRTFSVLVERRVAEAELLAEPGQVALHAAAAAGVVSV